MQQRLDSRIDPFAWQTTVMPGMEPRLLAGLPPSGTFRSLASHRAAFPVPPRAGRRTDPWLIDEVELAGLTGRGGADFPTARKWRAVAAGNDPVIVVNGAEGEPAAGKDALLMSRLPHLVIDGALHAAAAVGANRIIICVGEHSPSAVKAIKGALAERRKHEKSGISITMRKVPDRYVAGESSALVAMLNRQEAVPTSSPYRTAERGFKKRPTLVQNAETLAHVAMIMAFGADWYRSIGTEAEPGTRLVSLSGVTEPTVSEVASGASLLDILEAHGADANDVSAVLIGGFYGTWLRPEDALSSHLTIDSLAPFDATPGCGMLHFLPKGSCGIAAVSQLADWFARESAGQCGPCVFGLRAIADALVDVEEGFGGAMLGRIDRWTREIPGRGGCSLPDGAARMVRSGLSVFSADLAAHRRGRCSAEKELVFG